MYMSLLVYVHVSFSVCTCLFWCIYMSLLHTSIHVLRQSPDCICLLWYMYMSLLVYVHVSFTHEYSCVKPVARMYMSLVVYVYVSFRVCMYMSLFVHIYVSFRVCTCLFYIRIFMCHAGRQTVFRGFQTKQISFVFSKRNWFPSFEE